MLLQICFILNMLPAASVFHDMVIEVPACHQLNSVLVHVMASWLMLRSIYMAYRTQLSIENTQIGQGKQQYMHSIQGGSANAPPLVCLPGYGAGAAFYFRNFPSLCQHFRTYAVDPLGTGMSGEVQYQRAITHVSLTAIVIVQHVNSMHQCRW